MTMMNKMKKMNACDACASIFEIFAFLGEREDFSVDEDEEVLL